MTETNHRALGVASIGIGVGLAAMDLGLLVLSPEVALEQVTRTRALGPWGVAAIVGFLIASAAAGSLLWAGEHRAEAALVAFPLLLPFLLWYSMETCRELGCLVVVFLLAFAVVFVHGLSVWSLSRARGAMRGRASAIAVGLAGASLLVEWVLTTIPRPVTERLGPGEYETVGWEPYPPGAVDGWALPVALFSIVGLALYHAYVNLQAARADGTSSAASDP